jgi:hypothetical protein
MDFIKRLFCKKSSYVNRPLSLEPMPITVANANIKMAEESHIVEENSMTEKFFHEIKHEKKECLSGYGEDEDEDEEEPEPLTGNWATTMMTNEDEFEAEFEAKEETVNELN